MALGPCLFWICWLPKLNKNTQLIGNGPYGEIRFAVPYNKNLLYFTREICNCLNLFSLPIALKTACSGYLCNDTVQFQIKVRKFSRGRLRSSLYAERYHFTFLVCAEIYNARAQLLFSSYVLFRDVLVSVVLLVWLSSKVLTRNKQQLNSFWSGLKIKGFFISVRGLGGVPRFGNAFKRRFNCIGIDHIRILGTGLDLACNRGSRGNGWIAFALEKTSSIRLGCKLVPNTNIVNTWPCLRNLNAEET